MVKNDHIWSKQSNININFQFYLISLEITWRFSKRCHILSKLTISVNTDSFLKIKTDEYLVVHMVHKPFHIDYFILASVLNKEIFVIIFLFSLSIHFIRDKITKKKLFLAERGINSVKYWIINGSTKKSWLYCSTGTIFQIPDLSFQIT